MSRWPARSAGDGGGVAVRRLLVAGSVVLVLLTGACSSDGDDGGSGGEGAEAAPEEFCAMIEQFMGMDEDEVSEDEALALLDELIEASPRAGLTGALETVREMVSVPEDELSEDQFGEVFGATLLIGAYLEDECGIDAGLLDGGMQDDDVDVGFGDDEPGGDVESGDDEPSGVDDVVSPGESPMSLDSIQAAMEADHGGAAWLEALGSWSVSNERSVTVAPVSEDLSPADAMAACEALAAYVLDQEPEGSVTVSDTSGQPVVEAVDGQPCTAV